LLDVCYLFACIMTGMPDKKSQNPEEELQPRQTPFPFHPLLIGLYPFLALLGANLGQVNPVLTLRALLASLVVVYLVFFLLRRLVKDPHKAGLLAAWLLLLFFTYGHAYTLLEGKALFGMLLGRHLVLAPVWAVLAAGVGYLILRTKAPLQPATRILNIIAVLLAALVLVRIGAYFLTNTPDRTEVQQELPVQTPSEALPDVYYIILDAYSRPDMLEEYHNLDVTAFVQELESLGFVFPACTQSNYSITALSLASSLNMDYVEQIAPQIVQQNINWGAFSDYIVHSEVRKQFEALGYRFVTFETGIPWDEMPDAGLYLAREKSALHQMLNFRQITEFEMLYLRTTALRLADELRSSAGYTLADEVQSPQQDHYERILFVLDEFDNSAAVPGPKFVFLHLMAPHGPWVLGEDGSYTYTDNEMEGYARSVKYLNQRIPGILGSILANSEHPPVIILQGDHGFLNEERLAILNAYHLPGGSDGALYPAVSPVNTFRIIFNEYFGASYELLPDRSFLSDRDDPYNFSPVEYPCVSQP